MEVGSGYCAKTMNLGCSVTDLLHQSVLYLQTTLHKWSWPLMGISKWCYHYKKDLLELEMTTEARPLSWPRAPIPLIYALMGGAQKHTVVIVCHSTK